MAQEKRTLVKAGSAGYLARGHVAYDAAVAEFRRCYEHRAEEAAAALAALSRGDVEVFHQRGSYVPRDRTPVERPSWMEKQGAADAG